MVTSVVILVSITASTSAAGHRRQRSRVHVLASHNWLKPGFVGNIARM